MVIAIVIIIIVVIVLRRFKQRAKYDGREFSLQEKSTRTASSYRDNGSQCGVKTSEEHTTIVHEETPPPRFEILDVNKDCELREFIERSDRHFKSGCAFYQFTHEIEDISDDKEIVLMKKVVSGM